MSNRYKDDDLLTIAEVAEEFGYTHGYMASLFAPGSDAHDPILRRMSIRTDKTYRKAFNTTAQYVFRYADMRRWFNDRQSLPSVQTYNESRGIVVE